MALTLSRSLPTTSDRAGLARFGKWSWLVLAMALVLPGCKSGGRKKPELDREFQRHTDAARLAFSEGLDAKAVASYRLAVKRAWSLDEPIEIGRSSYNLAACLASLDHWPEARDWLAEARAELWRGGQDLSEAWLLEAKIARQQGLIDEAAAISEVLLDKHPGAGTKSDCRHATYATVPPGVPPAPSEIHCAHVDLKPKRREKAEQMLGRWREKSQRGKNHESRTNTVQVHLLLANLACDRRDLETAEAEWALAKAELATIIDPVVRAEAARVSGRIWLLSEEPYNAAAEFDREAELLRLGKHYREIPYALYDAAEAYAVAGVPPAAADRYLRTARALYGRDELVDALVVIDEALPWVEMSGNGDLEGRIAVLFREVAEAVEKERRKNEGSSRDRNRTTTNDTVREPVVTPIPTPEMLDPTLEAPAELPVPGEPGSPGRNDAGPSDAAPNDIRPGTTAPGELRRTPPVQRGPELKMPEALRRKFGRPAASRHG